MSLIEEKPFYIARRTKQLRDIKTEIRKDNANVKFSIDDTFDLATRVQGLLDNEPHKIYKQVRSIMYRGKSLVSLRLTVAGSEILRKDTDGYIY